MVAEPLPDEGAEATGEDLLPAADVAFLRHKGLRFRAVAEQRVVHLVIPDYPLPDGFSQACADLLIDLPAPGWPDAKPDMWWLYPWVTVTKTGQPADRADQPRDWDGLRWQRWSRHFNDALWIAGRDGIGSYLAIVDRELMKAVA